MDAPPPDDPDPRTGSMEPPEADHDRVARRAAREKNAEPLRRDPPPGALPSDADVQAERQPAGEGFDAD